MQNSKVEICFIGNAIVDILSKMSNETLNKLKIPKGSMQLVDEEETNKMDRNKQGTDKKDVKHDVSLIRRDVGQPSRIIMCH